MDFVIPAFGAQIHSSLALKLERQSRVVCVFLVQPVQFWQIGRREHTITLCLKQNPSSVLVHMMCFIERELS